MLAVVMTFNGELILAGLFLLSAKFLFHKKRSS